MSGDIVLVDVPKTISLKLSEKLRKAIAIALEIGYAENAHDLVRKATIDKLESLGIFNEMAKNFFSIKEQNQ